MFQYFLCLNMFQYFSVNRSDCSFRFEQRARTVLQKRARFPREHKTNNTGSTNIPLKITTKIRVIRKKKKNKTKGGEEGQRRKSPKLLLWFSRARVYVYLLGLRGRPCVFLCVIVCMCAKAKNQSAKRN